ncbi:glycine zipper domain-containing protein [Nitrospinae bacterium AH-259-F20]|nr:glycine zipper domain-containing protein [Nitrospinae bacterium AH-259-F20]
MNRISALLAIAVMLLASGCAGRELTTTEKTTVGGALLGAGTGALIGSATGKAGTGALLGAGVGALGGALMGQVVEAEAAKQRRLAEQQRYRQGQLGTYGSPGVPGPTVGGSTVAREQQLQAEQERQRQLELEIAREKQRQLEEELARLRAERQGTQGALPSTPTSSELSTRVARDYPTLTDKQERLKVVGQKIGDLKEELDLARRIDNLDLQRELDQQIKELEEERAELERQITFTR